MSKSKNKSDEIDQLKKLLSEESSSQKSKINDKNINQHKIFNLLENEENRMKKISFFFSQQITNVTLYGQEDALIKEEKVKNNNLKKEILTFLNNNQTNLQKKLDSIFNHFYKF